MEQHEKKPEKYQPVRLPYDPWHEAGERLILPMEVQQDVSRIGAWRLREQEEDEGSGLFLFSGPPGTGKSVAARFAADASVRMVGGRGNALIVHAPSLFSEELGRSAKLVGELFQAIEFSASRYPTICIWDDAEGVFCSREQVIANKDPSDLLRVTTSLNAGFDRLQGMTNVMHLATGNFAGVFDPAIVDRIDYVVPFGLPGFQERMEIIRGRLKGFAGEWVLAELAAATEGWSGRQLAKLVMRAYLASTVRTRKELTAEDFLRAVRLMPGNGDVVTNGNESGTHSVSPAEAVAVSVTANGALHHNGSHGTNGKEGEGCQNGQQASSRNGSQQASSPPQTRSEAPSSWFERLQRCPSFPPLPPI